MIKNKADWIEREPKDGFILLTWKFSAALGSPGFLSGWTILACKRKKDRMEGEINHEMLKWHKGGIVHNHAKEKEDIKHQHKCSLLNKGVT